MLYSVNMCCGRYQGRGPGDSPVSCYEYPLSIKPLSMCPNCVIGNTE